MKRNISDYLVAFAVIACSLVLLGALTFALSGYQVKKPSRTLEIDFSDVAGIKLHSEVRYAGALAGRVITMRHLTADERAGSKSAVRVTASINDDIPPLPADIKATLGSDTLLSEKFVALSAGTAGGKILASGAAIEGQAAFSIDQLAQSAGPILENATDLLSTLRLELSAILPKISTLADSTGVAAKSADALLMRANNLIASNEGDLHSRLQELEGVINNVNALLTKTNDFVGSTDKDLDARMKELRVVLQNLKVVSTHAKAITTTLGEKPSRLIWGTKPNKLVPENAILKSSEPVPATRP